jgi:hypothetical protein
MLACDNKGAITGLNLTAFGLIGTLPSQLANFMDLTYLILDDNPGMACAFSIEMQTRLDLSSHLSFSYWNK